MSTACPLGMRALYVSIQNLAKARAIPTPPVGIDTTVAEYQTCDQMIAQATAVVNRMQTQDAAYDAMVARNTSEWDAVSTYQIDTLAELIQKYEENATAPAMKNVVIGLRSLSDHLKATRSARKDERDGDFLDLDALAVDQVIELNKRNLEQQEQYKQQLLIMAEQNEDLQRASSASSASGARIPATCCLAHTDSSEVLDLQKNNAILHSTVSSMQGYLRKSEDDLEESQKQCKMLKAQIDARSRDDGADAEKIQRLQETNDRLNAVIREANTAIETSRVGAHTTTMELRAKIDHERLRHKENIDTMVSEINDRKIAMIAERTEYANKVDQLNATIDSLRIEAANYRTTNEKKILSLNNVIDKLQCLNNPDTPPETAAKDVVPTPQTTDPTTCEDVVRSMVNMDDYILVRYAKPGTPLSFSSKVVASEVGPFRLVAPEPARLAMEHEEIVHLSNALAAVATNQEKNNDREVCALVAYTPSNVICDPHGKEQNGVVTLIARANGSTANQVVLYALDGEKIDHLLNIQSGQSGKNPSDYPWRTIGEVDITQMDNTLDHALRGITKKEIESHLDMHVTAVIIDSFVPVESLYNGLRRRAFKKGIPNAINPKVLLRRIPPMTKWMQSAYASLFPGTHHLTQSRISVNLMENKNMAQYALQVNKSVKSHIVKNLEN